MEDLQHQKLELAHRLTSDFSYYASECLRIRTKSGSLEPLALNTAQAHLNAVAERQLKDRGYVRIIGLKGRQQGFSTYVEGRLYWKTSTKKGKRAFILTHDSEATKNLFEMTERYHGNCPPLLRPEIGASNAKEMEFVNLDSGYRIGTAGNKETGRSQTIQYMHGSEVAFWVNARRIARGLMQAVPSGTDAVGTEIWLESTSDGPSNYFHTEWVKAVNGLSEFEAVFIPWFWQKEYQSAWKPEWRITDKETELMRAHGLSKEQLAWRRLKIQELGELDDTGMISTKLGEIEFKREYPNTPEEAFETASGNLIDVSHLQYYDMADGLHFSECTIVILVDAANEKKENSDYTAMWVWALAPDQNYYLVDAVHDKLNPTERVARYMRLHRKWHKLSGKHPRDGYEKYGNMTDTHYVKEQQKKDGYRFEIKELGGSQPKTDRIKRLIPIIENRQVYFPRSLLYSRIDGLTVDLIPIIKNELSVFPGGSKVHDDLIDAASRIFDMDVNFPALSFSANAKEAQRNADYAPLDHGLTNEISWENA